MNDYPDYANPGLPSAHHLTHEDEGQDEIDVTGLSGELADEQDAGTIKGKTIDAPIAADDGKFLKYHHANAKYTHDILTAGGGLPILPWFYDSVVQGTFINFASPGYLMGGFLYNSSFADQDQVNYKLWLGAGTYTFKLLHATSTTHGILKILIDAAEVASFDTYGPASYNKVSTATGINISTTGIKTISLKVDGKNPSSSGYYMSVSAFTLYRTA